MDGKAPVPRCEPDNPSADGKKQRSVQGVQGPGVWRLLDRGLYTVSGSIVTAVVVRLLPHVSVVHVQCMSAFVYSLAAPGFCSLWAYMLCM